MAIESIWVNFFTEVLGNKQFKKKQYQFYSTNVTQFSHKIKYYHAKTHTHTHTHTRARADCFKNKKVKSTQRLFIT